MVLQRCLSKHPAEIQQRLVLETYSAGRYGEESSFGFRQTAFQPLVNRQGPNRLDREGELVRFAAELGRRVGKPLVPKRLNEGLGLTYRDVTDASTADLIRQIFADDFVRFDFPVESFPVSVAPVVATERESQAIRYARSLTVRLEQLSRLARYRTTGRHVVAQALRNIGLRR